MNIHGHNKQSGCRRVRLRRWCVMAGWLCAMSAPCSVDADSMNAANQAPRTPSAVEYHKGIAHLAAGEIKQAEKAFNTSLRHDPKNVDAYLGKAELARRQNRLDEAASLVKRALELAPQDPRVHLARGRHLIGKRQFKDAESALERATALFPGFADAHMELGDLRADLLKKPREAANAYRAAVQANPMLWRAHYGLALQQAKIGASDEAHRAFTEARKLAPSNPLPLYAEGNLYAKEGKPDQALHAFNEALQVKSDSVPILLARADLYRLATHQFEKAAEDYRTVLKLAAHEGRAHNGLALALKEAGNIGEAIEHLKLAGRLNPKVPGPWFELGRLYGQQKKYGDAIKAFEAAVKADAKFVPAVVGRADMYLAQGKYEPALSDYSEALKLTPNSSPLHVKIGVAHARQRHWSEAERLFKKAIELNPKAAEAWNNLAWIVIERKQNPDDAVAWARKAVDLEPARAVNHDTLGWAYRARGDLTKAATSLARAAELDPKDPVIQYHCGVVYAEQQKLGAAREALRNALSLDQAFDGADDARQRLSSLSQAAAG